MSNSLAIAAVTATLQRLIKDGLTNAPAPLPQGFSPAGIQVTSQPPEKTNGEEVKRINIFLYHMQPNAAYRNMDMPGRVKPGETGFPPLALNLFYLVTAYGRDLNSDDLISQFLLCSAMHTLHDHPLLDGSEIKDALTGNDLHEQIERVRITPQSLSLDEMYKLWSAFQAPARTSAAYQVSVVLIESQRPVKTPLPVLSRGDEDRGVDVVQGALPLINAVISSTGLPAIRLGEEFTIRGEHLKDEIVGVIIKSLRSEQLLAPESLIKTTDLEIVAKLPAPGLVTDTNSPAATWPVGRYEIAVSASRAGEAARTSNAFGFMIAPSITVAQDASTAGDVNVTVTSTQNILPEQTVSLLFGAREIKLPASAHTTATSTLTVLVEGASAGEHVVRLRVDGVDSLPVDTSVKPPKFSDDQKVKLT